MKCAEVKQQLDFLIDAEIKSPQKEEIRRHLQDCADCLERFENLQIVGQLLKEYLPVSAPVNLDKKVLEAFYNHHKSKKPLPAVSEKVGFLRRILVPVPVFAAVFAAFAFAFIAAYQFGKMSANANLTAGKSSLAAANKISEPSQNTPVSIVKYVEVPVAKIVQVPVFRERVITRFVEKNKNVRKPTAPRDSKPSETVTAANKKNQYLIQFSLEGFQPVSELKPKIIKKERN